MGCDLGGSQEDYEGQGLGWSSSESVLSSEGEVEVEQFIQVVEEETAGQGADSQQRGQVVEGGGGGGGDDQQGQTEGGDEQTFDSYVYPPCQTSFVLSIDYFIVIGHVVDFVATSQESTHVDEQGQEEDGLEDIVGGLLEERVESDVGEDGQERGQVGGGEDFVIDREDQLAHLEEREQVEPIGLFR